MLVVALAKEEAGGERIIVTFGSSYYYLTPNPLFLPNLDVNVYVLARIVRVARLD
jgi:hypothetical protein